jgi:hypothetical protein
VLDRFFQYILSDLLTRNVIASTDATGYSERKQGWREATHVNPATQDWTKTNVIIEVDEFIIMAYFLSSSDVYEPQTFQGVWNNLPQNDIPVRCLADKPTLAMIAWPWPGSMVPHRCIKSRRTLRTPRNQKISTRKWSTIHITGRSVST